MNTPRYASLPGIMKAKKKVIKELALDGLSVAASDFKVSYCGHELPPEKPAAKILAGDMGVQVKELVKLLREEAKII